MPSSKRLNYLSFIEEHAQCFPSLMTQPEAVLTSTGAWPLAADRPWIRQTKTPRTISPHELIWMKAHVARDAKRTSTSQ